jgi:hypothetical protein
MLKRSLLATLLLAVATTAYADTFQLLFKSGNDTYRVANAPIEVFDSKNQRRFGGYTDQDGSVLIALPNGNYRARVTYRGAPWCAAFSVDGAKPTKPVYITKCQ